MKTGRRLAGFTLIEMVVVMAIITILASILVPMVFRAKQDGKRARAVVEISTISIALDTFQQDWGVYPPHRQEDLGDFTRTISTTTGMCEPPAAEVFVTIVGAKQDDDTKKSLVDTNRILVRFLSTEVKNGPYLKISANDLEKDGDFQHPQGSFVLDCREGTSSSTGVPAYKFIDPWGNPYIYRNNFNAFTPDSFNDYVPHNRKGFDIYSCGMDGKTAIDEGIADRAEDGQGEDDINNWGVAH